MWFVRTTLLQATADLWIISDPITPADAAVVLSGGYDVRPVVAAELYGKGLVRKVLISRVDENGVAYGDTDLNRTILLKLGVPESAIGYFGNGSKNTWDEAVALKGWTKQHRTSAFIIPVEVFFARRARWVFRREFFGTGIQIAVPSSNPPRAYSQIGWWKSDGGLTTFPSEVIKYIYYRFKY
jgi:uncharacterized SAM-binding protein YcdF (DUF218 family)